jgi:glutathione S-transferase
MIESDMATRTWAMGDTFSMADCAAGPALAYANEVLPLAAHPNVTAYLRRLVERPSFARARHEAEPYLKFFPR